jgi:hypothetical protein
MNKSERMDYIVKMFQQLNPEEKITSDTIIRGTPIWKLCNSDGGPYQRIKTWCEKKITEKKLIEEENDDMLKAKKEYDKCFDLMKSRNKKYGDSWKVLTIQSIANLCEMKLHRIANMNNQDLDPKIEDELRDTANYMIFALIKFYELS